jgi:hypothetical protein
MFKLYWYSNRLRPIFRFSRRRLFCGLLGRDTVQLYNGYQRFGSNVFLRNADTPTGLYGVTTI